MKTFPFDIQKLTEICHQNNIKQLSIFGSMARGEATIDSDIDLLVKFYDRKSLLAIIKLEREISTALNRKVDLLTEAAISPYLRKGIKQDLKVIYEA